VRGSLEVLRDAPDLADADRDRFINIALRACGRLQHAVSVVAKTVYAQCHTDAAEPDPAHRAFLARMNFLDEFQVLDLGFSDYLFDASEAVHSFFDAIDVEIERRGRKWGGSLSISGTAKFGRKPGSLMPIAASGSIRCMRW